MKALSTLAVFATGFALLDAAPPHTLLRGYTLSNSDRERALEARFVDLPSAQSALDTSATIGGRPHYAGTPGDRALAISMRDAMRSAGIAAELEPFTTRVDTPRELVLAVAPAADTLDPVPRARGHRRQPEFPIALDTSETGDAGDPATTEPGIGLPFNAGSADGDVRAPLVYAARGLESDYATLAAARVDVTGAVVLVRYGAQFRGLLAERAQAHGASAVLFYSDPADDGAARGLVYPNGPWRPLAAIQRGSVGSAVHIPTLPISALNARTLLGALRGAAGPADWGGALPVAYPLARGPGRVHLIVKLNRKTTTLWNTIGVIPGVRGDQSIILGAHRDAWVFGVGDNGAGVTTLLEVARGFGLLLKGGWQPQRTIVIAGWDGAEIGLAGSRAYVQVHRVELERGCFAYLNADENVTGATITAEAVAALAPVMVDATRSVLDPTHETTTIYERWAAQTPRSAPRVELPGGGSDYNSFLTGPGIPVANLRFSGPFGVYHSSYDTLRYATLFSDPGFVLHRAAAQLYGVLALRLADADVVPYSFGGYITQLRRGAAAIAASIAHDRTSAGTSALKRAIDRVAAAAVRIDSGVVRADGDFSGRQLRAARELDSLLYGANGYAGITFPELNAALVTGRKPGVDAALANAVDSLGRAADALALDAARR